MANAAVLYADDRSSERPKVQKSTQKQPSTHPSPSPAFTQKIKVIGVGGGGNNALDHIIRTGATGVEFLAVNTDAHCLEQCLSVEKLVIGERLTKGHGAGARPEVGAEAAHESREMIRDCLKGCDMVYLAAGMGGGTGTGAMPVIAALAKEMGILTVAVVTRPFAFEGRRRTQYANEGIEKLKEAVDALIVVQNDKLISTTEKMTTLTDAFALADNVLREAVQGVTDLVTTSGTVNVDFADLRSVMRHAGGAVMGIGYGSGEFRAQDALKRAMESPLMENSLQGAKGVILNITSSSNISLLEVNEASSMLSDMIDEHANFIWGHVVDESMGEDIKMVVIATGFDFDDMIGTSIHDAPLRRKAALEQQAAQAQAQQFQTPRARVDEQMAIDTPFDTPTYLRKRNV